MYCIVLHLEKLTIRILPAHLHYVHVSLQKSMECCGSWELPCQLRRCADLLVYLGQVFQAGQR